MIPASDAFNLANAQLTKKPIYIIEINGYHYAFSNGEEAETGIMYLHVEGQE